MLFKERCLLAEQWGALCWLDCDVYQDNMDAESDDDDYVDAMQYDDDDDDIHIFNLRGINSCKPLSVHSYILLLPNTTVVQ